MLTLYGLTAVVIGRALFDLSPVSAYIAVHNSTGAEMKISRWAGAMLLASCASAFATDATNFSAADTFIRCLSMTYSLQKEAKADLKKQKTQGAETLMLGVRNLTKSNIETRTMIGMLKQLDVTPTGQQFVNGLIDYYQQKIDTAQAMIDITAKMAGGQQPGVDYGQLAVDFTQLGAAYEEEDKAIFKIAPGFGLMLMDQHPDAAGHLTHLLISRKQRADLLHLIDTDFGAAVDDKNATWTVSSAWVMKTFLKKDIKASDDPW